MDGQVANLYHLPDIEKYQDLHLLTLSEYCAVLEEQVYTICRHLPDQERQIIEAYIRARNDLEVETVKTALRWGKNLNSVPLTPTQQKSPTMHGENVGAHHDAPAGNYQNLYGRFVNRPYAAKNPPVFPGGFYLVHQPLMAAFHSENR